MDNSMEGLLTKERADTENRKWWIDASVINRNEMTYVFVADHIKTKQHNTEKYLASIRSWHYFFRS